MMMLWGALVFLVREEAALLALKINQLKQNGRDTGRRSRGGNWKGLIRMQQGGHLALGTESE
jgi:hypothetical protein